MAIRRRKCGYIGLGLLLKAGLVKEDILGGGARIFYCPTFDGDRFQGFNSEENKWPPSQDTTRCTYSCRGSTNDTNPSSGTFATDDVCWGTGSKKEVFAPLVVTNGTANSPAASVRGRAHGS